MWAWKWANFMFPTNYPALLGQSHKTGGRVAAMQWYNRHSFIHPSIRPWRGANKCFCGRAIRIRSAQKKNRNTIIEKGLRMNNYPIAEYNSITRQHDAYKCQEWLCSRDCCSSSPATIQWIEFLIPSIGSDWIDSYQKTLFSGFFMHSGLQQGFINEAILSSSHN